jgi:TrkA domain protein
MPADSPYVGRPLGDTRARTRTGASIVAILRGHEVVPSPTPDAVLFTSDTLVAVGTRKGLDALSSLIAHGPS